MGWLLPNKELVLILAAQKKALAFSLIPRVEATCYRARACAPMLEGWPRSHVRTLPLLEEQRDCDVDTQSEHHLVDGSS